ncbi:MAG: hypothetical protein H7A35_01925 [Planctomycetales bacterium]|nr:hypothetical protein [bacterium]UNM08817.1 MAG: hypothetical protein H7A35_01925 [Planctomycetales bacterium]
MKVREWNYSTNKELRLFDFHDVFCGPVVRRNGNASFATTDGPNMSAEHPSNPYDAPMELGRSCITFCNVAEESFELDAGLIDNGKEERQLPRRVISSGSLYEVKQLASRITARKELEIQIYGELREQSREFNDEMLTWRFLCSGFLLRWNSFNRTSWFHEGEHFRIEGGRRISLGYRQNRR